MSLIDVVISITGPSVDNVDCVLCANSTETNRIEDYIRSNAKEPCINDAIVKMKRSSC